MGFFDGLALLVKYHFCTYFDHRYVSRGLALYQSLTQQCSDFTLYILCLDQRVSEIFSEHDYPQIRSIALRQLENVYPELLSAKKNRSMIEYYFTLTPFLPLFILDQFPSVDLITYLDADLYFFHDPAELFEEMASGSVGIIAHRFPERLKKLECYGIYNVGWISFRRDTHAKSCLDWWSAKCLAWCSDKLDSDRFADQKYLDEWPGRFPGVVVLEHKGANVAPWNLENYKIVELEQEIWVDNQRLLFFHFHGLRKISANLYCPNLHSFGLETSRIPPVIIEGIFGKYLGKLKDLEEKFPETQTPDVPALWGIRKASRSMPYKIWSLITFYWGFMKRRYISVA